MCSRWVGGGRAAHARAVCARPPSTAAPAAPGRQTDLRATRAPPSPLRYPPLPSKIFPLGPFNQLLRLPPSPPSPPSCPPHPTIQVKADLRTIRSKEFATGYSLRFPHVQEIRRAAAARSAAAAAPLPPGRARCCRRCPRRRCRLGCTAARSVGPQAPRPGPALASSHPHPPPCLTFMASRWDKGCLDINTIRDLQDEVTAQEKKQLYNTEVSGAAGGGGASCRGRAAAAAAHTAAAVPLLAVWGNRLLPAASLVSAAQRLPVCWHPTPRCCPHCLQGEEAQGGKRKRGSGRGGGGAKRAKGPQARAVLGGGDWPSGKEVCLVIGGAGGQGDLAHGRVGAERCLVGPAARSSRALACHRSSVCPTLLACSWQRFRWSTLSCRAARLYFITGTATGGGGWVGGAAARRSAGARRRTAAGSKRPAVGVAAPTGTHAAQLPAES